MIDQLIDKIIETSNPTVVGLDPRMDYTPSFLLEENFAKYGHTLKAVAEAYLQFNKGIIDAIWDIVPAVKPQVAMYEQLGTAGMEAYIETIQYAKSKGMVVIGDIKRSDIASTAEAYAEGHIGRVVVADQSYNVYQEDFITLNPYLGSDSIDPYLPHCEKYNKGLFILVKTSNPNSGEIQDLETAGGKIYEVVGQLVSKWGQATIGKHGYSQVGAVVGATHKEQGIALRAQMPTTFFLVPGYGAQGATAEDLKGCFDANGLGAIVNSSRGIIAAYKNKKYSQHGERGFAAAAREAALDMKNDLSICLK